MSEHFKQLRKEKELIKMREALMSDWRNDLMEEEEHPYVDVMPSTDQKEKDAKKKKKEKEEEKSEKEEVKEGFFSAVSKKKRAEAKDRLERHRKGEEVYFKKKKKPLFSDKPLKDPWGAHPEDAKAHSKGYQKGGEVKEEVDLEENILMDILKGAGDAASRVGTAIGNKAKQAQADMKSGKTDNMFTRAHQSHMDANERHTNDARAVFGMKPKTSTPTKPAASTPTKPATKPTAKPAASAPTKPAAAPKPAAVDNKSAINKEYDRLRKSGDMKAAKDFGMKKHKELFNKTDSKPSVSSGATDIGKAAAPTPAPKVSAPAPKVSGIKSAGLSKALSDTASMKFKSEEVVHESIKDDPEHQKNFKDAADRVAKGMAARRKKLDLGKGKKEKK